MTNFNQPVQIFEVRVQRPDDRSVEIHETERRKRKQAIIKANLQPPLSKLGKWVQSQHVQMVGIPSNRNLFRLSLGKLLNHLVRWSSTPRSRKWVQRYIWLKVGIFKSECRKQEQAFAESLWVPLARSWEMSSKLHNRTVGIPKHTKPNQSESPNTQNQTGRPKSPKHTKPNRLTEVSLAENKDIINH